MEDARLLSKKCIYFLNQEEFAPYIANCRQLHQKMKKYYYKFDETVNILKKVFNIPETQAKALPSGLVTVSDEDTIENRECINFWDQNRDPQDCFDMEFDDDDEDQDKVDPNDKVHIDLDFTLSTVQLTESNYGTSHRNS